MIIEYGTCKKKKSQGKKDADLRWERSYPSDLIFVECTAEKLGFILHTPETFRKAYDILTKTKVF